MLPAWEPADLPTDAVEVGRILNAWGVKGWFKVSPHSASPQALFSSKRWYLQPTDKGPKTFEGTGLTPKIFQGASDLYAQIAGTPQGKESPEDARAKGRKGTEVINDLADTIK